ncbi:hypothetical protein [Cytobacillus dafuensis]|uniref:Copper amine oxidase-like N-terminal domain-containing protein n=1 Tax=Cytobacillus dafuensis TaxID=1742359 RepID=A0A5B8Z213_CYTDA|nr:hypothetical protein [Cytobacillus dafuensis]QED47035.1 hypothetical protein FSZ17_07135 [Cytobacillus dafuensis]
MGKKVLYITLCCMFISLPVYAHLTGVFVDMLEENSIEILKEQIDETKKEIEDLEPNVQTLEDDFQMKIKEFEPTFIFYQTQGLEAYFKTMGLSTSLIEFFTFQKLAQDKINEDLEQLEAMYTDFLPLKVRHDSLVSYQSLLEVLGENLARREEILNEVGNNPSTEEVSEKISEIWTQNIGYLLELPEDGEVIVENIQSLVKRTTSDSAYRIEEKSVNKLTKLNYYIRSDHVYIHLDRKEAHLILIGRFLKEDKEISLDIEAGFINGFVIPEELLGILKGFSIDYSLINQDSDDFYFEQTNGALIIQPIEVLQE